MSNIQPFRGKRAAFYLLAGIIGVELLILAGSTAACFALKVNKCDGKQISQALNGMVASAFALYAAEK